MSDLLFHADDAATPLTADERQALIPSFITLRRELNEAEQRGITAAESWALARWRNVLDEAFLRRLHWQMFYEVWRWAGSYRTTAGNLGVEPWRIGPELRQLLDDVRYWHQLRTYPADEIGARFHHRLVSIHPFPNGNGRHARLAADMLAMKLGRPRFSWGRESLVSPGDARQRYVAALQAADGHAIDPLLTFMRS